MDTDHRWSSIEHSPLDDVDVRVPGQKPCSERDCIVAEVVAVQLSLFVLRRKNLDTRCFTKV